MVYSRGIASFVGRLWATIGHLSGLSYRYRFFNLENIGFGPTLLDS
jgi:hypothetical protein